MFPKNYFHHFQACSPPPTEQAPSSSLCFLLSLSFAIKKSGEAEASPLITGRKTDAQKRSALSIAGYT